MVAQSSQQKVLVVGATGATGKYVVAKLLAQKIPTKVIVRSKERFLGLLPLEESNAESYDEKLLTVREASLLDLSDEEIDQQVSDCTVVISCLGHNLTFSGIWGHPRRLVSDAATKLTQAMIKASKASKSKTLPKFILMGSDGVANPDGTDDERSFSERTILSLLRLLIPPHVDNEMAAAYLANTLGTDCASLEWTIVRPTDLVDESAIKDYQLFDKPQGSLFGSGQATRSNVAQYMVDLVIDKNDLWKQYKFKMPVLHDGPAAKDDKEQEEAVAK